MKHFERAVLCAAFGVPVVLVATGAVPLSVLGAAFEWAGGHLPLLALVGTAGAVLALVGLIGLGLGRALDVDMPAPPAPEPESRIAIHSPVVEHEVLNTEASYPAGVRVFVISNGGPAW